MARYLILASFLTVGAYAARIANKHAGHQSQAVVHASDLVPGPILPGHRPAMITGAPAVAPSMQGGNAVPLPARIHQAAPPSRYLLPLMHTAVAPKRHAGVHMYINHSSAAKLDYEWEGGDKHFEAALSGLILDPVELPKLRRKFLKLEEQLLAAIDIQDFSEAARLRDLVRELRSMDPAQLLSSLRLHLHSAIKGERYKEAAKYRDQLRVVKMLQPEYKLEGMWKGNYPNSGECFVYIAYDGDLLTATKLTGDPHVPEGAVTFRVDLSQANDERSATAAYSDDGVSVEVMTIGDNGTQKEADVVKLAGEGSIAKKDFEQAHFIPGQLFLMEEDVIGFLWAAIGTFVVFTKVDEQNTSLGIEGDHNLASAKSALEKIFTLDVDMDV